MLVSWDGSTVQNPAEFFIMQFFSRLLRKFPVLRSYYEVFLLCLKLKVPCEHWLFLHVTSQFWLWPRGIITNLARDLECKVKSSASWLGWWMPMGQYRVQYLMPSCNFVIELDVVGNLVDSHDFWACASVIKSWNDPVSDFCWDFVGMGWAAQKLKIKKNKWIIWRRKSWFFSY